MPKTPEQNGIAERMNRTLVETVQSMLFDARVPHSFWAEALSTAVYLRNRSPTKVLDDMTRFEAWMKEKTRVEHFVFLAVMHMLMWPKMKDKNSSQTQESVFFWAMEKQPNDTDCMICVHQK